MHSCCSDFSKNWKQRRCRTLCSTLPYGHACHFVFVPSTFHLAHRPTSFCILPTCMSSVWQDKPIDAVAFCHSGIPVASMLGKRLTQQVRTKKQKRFHQRYKAFNVNQRNNLDCFGLVTKGATPDCMPSMTKPTRRFRCHSPSLSSELARTAASLFSLANRYVGQYV